MITSCLLPVITCVKTGSDLRSEVPLALIGSQMVDIGLIFNTNHMGPKWKLRYAKKSDTYSPHMDFVISLIFYFTTAFFWAITFENPSINDGMAAIWN